MAAVVGIATCRTAAVTNREWGIFISILVVFLHDSQPGYGRSFWGAPRAGPRRAGRRRRAVHRPQEASTESARIKTG